MKIFYADQARDNFEKGQHEEALVGIKAALAKVRTEITEASKSEVCVRYLFNNQPQLYSIVKQLRDDGYTVTVNTDMSAIIDWTSR